MPSTRSATRRRPAKRKPAKRHGRFKGFRVDFWAALRKATHTDRLGHRLGMAVGTRIHAHRIARKGFSVPAGTRSATSARKPRAATPAPPRPKPVPKFTRQFTPYPTGSAYHKGGTMQQEATLGEAPETDAEHTATLTSTAGKVRACAEAVEDYISTCVEMGIDVAALGPLEQAANLLSEAAMALDGSVAAFQSTYEGIIDTVESGVSLPKNGGGTFFDRGRS